MSVGMDTAIFYASVVLERSAGLQVCLEIVQIILFLVHFVDDHH
jgi:hypothetical protein